MEIQQLIIRYEDLKQDQFTDGATGNLFQVQVSPELKAITVNVQLQRMNFEQRARGFNKSSGFGDDIVTIGGNPAY